MYKCSYYGRIFIFFPEICIKIFRIVIELLSRKLLIFELLALNVNDLILLKSYLRSIEPQYFV